MKRYGNLFPKIYDTKNIELAHKNARIGKKHYREVKNVDLDPERHFLIIQEMLKNRTFKNSPYEVFTRTEGGKEREIFKLPYFPDRIIHHCVLQVVGPIWTRTLISDTYACVKGRGIHKGVNRIKAALVEKENTRYCLKCDVRKFYPSVDHEVLKKIILRKIKDEDLLWLLDEIVDSTHGIPIGNYLSQHFGNIYLSGFDHWIKEDRGCRHYFRYCDDLVVLHGDKDFLHGLRLEMETYLKEDLNLDLKGNWQVFPVDSRGIDFLGYRFFHDYVLLRKSIVKRIKAKVDDIKRNWRHMVPLEVISGIMSYYGWMKHANCMNLMKSILDDKLLRILARVCERAGVGNPLSKIAMVAE